MSLSARCQEIRASLSGFDADKVSRVFPGLEDSVDRLQELQRYVYSDRNVARVALVHRSALVHWPLDKSGVVSNERLEFLGDAFLNLFVAVETMLAYPDWQEGELSKLRSALVGEENLAQKARGLGIGEILILGRGEALQNGRNRPSILADAFEAAAAALLLDAGEERASRWLDGILRRDITVGQETLGRFDVKSRLQQLVQALIGEPPQYRVIGTVSTPASNEFLVAAFVGRQELARASAPNKRSATKLVAEKVLAQIEKGELTDDQIVRFHKERDI
jgi:ribonuclease-3